MLTDVIALDEGYNQTVDAQLSPTGGYNKFYAQTGEVQQLRCGLSLEFKEYLGISSLGTLTSLVPIRIRFWVW